MVFIINELLARTSHELSAVDCRNQNSLIKVAVKNCIYAFVYVNVYIYININVFVNVYMHTICVYICMWESMHLPGHTSVLDMTLRLSSLVASVFAY